jgi:hypothetical protein
MLAGITGKKKRKVREVEAAENQHQVARNQQRQ